MTDEPRSLTPYDLDIKRISLGFWVIIAGFALTGVALSLGVWQWNAHNLQQPNVASGDVVAIVGSVTGIIGTVIGTFFGVNVGAAGRAQSEAAREKVTDQALKLAGAADPAAAASALGRPPLQQ